MAAYVRMNLNLVSCIIVEPDSTLTQKKIWLSEFQKIVILKILQMILYEIVLIKKQVKPTPAGNM